MQTLHLNGISTIDDMTDNGQNYIAHAVVSLKAAACPRCKHVKLYEFGNRAIRVIDLPIHGKQVLINLDRKRYRCQKCKHTFMPVHPEIDTEFRLTTRAVKWIERESMRQTFAYIAHQIGIDEITVRRVFWRYAQNREKTLKPTAGRAINRNRNFITRRWFFLCPKPKTVNTLNKDR